MKIRNIFRTFKLSSNTILKPLYLEAYDKYNEIEKLLTPKHFDNIPKITRISDDIIEDNNFSLPSIKEDIIYLPIYNLENQFLNKGIYLENLIFNQPIRKDLIFRLHHFQRFENKITTHIVKRLNEVAGSGKKPFPQKGRGKARQGNKRAPGRYKGGKAHGRRMRDMSIDLPKKVKLMAIKSLFSSKLSTGGIRIIESEKVDTIKTKNLNNKLNSDESMIFILPKNYNNFFKIASKNLKNIKIISIDQIIVNDILKFDKIIFTEESLKEFTSFYLASTVINYKPKFFRPNINLKEEKKEDVIYNPNEPLELNFEILKDYYNKIN